MDDKSNKILARFNCTNTSGFVCHGLLELGEWIDSKRDIAMAYKILQTPTPLWLSIVLISVALSYSYLKSLKPASSSDIPYKTNYFIIDNLKWKTKVYNHGYFEVERIAICKEHDIPLINANIIYYCPEHLKKNCNIKINNTDYSMLYEHAKSYIDKEVRKQKKC